MDLLARSGCYEGEEAKALQLRPGASVIMLERSCGLPMQPIGNSGVSRVFPGNLHRRHFQRVRHSSSRWHLFSVQPRTDRPSFFLFSLFIPSYHPTSLRHSSHSRNFISASSPPRIVLLTIFSPAAQLGLANSASVLTSGPCFFANVCGHPRQSSSNRLHNPFLACNNAPPRRTGTF
jgi:hypothetical protein